MDYRGASFLLRKRKGINDENIIKSYKDEKTLKT